MSWEPGYAILIFASTIVGYFTAIAMEENQGTSKNKLLLLISLIFNLALLFVFKYYNFFIDSINSIFTDLSFSSSLKLLLPVGISFYTFQILSYSIDVYRGELKAEKHFGIFALYVSFFPQLVAGPIERSNRLLPQFFKRHDFDYQRISRGAKFILSGIIKKVIIADRLAIYVDSVYLNPQDFTGIPLLIAAFLFALQAYYDFSGYSDIAIGSALVLGFKIINNFNRPFFSKTITEFWRRWHISLSTWIHDYLYAPLIIKYRYWGQYGVVFVLIITFALIGLWHGANWTFVVFGLLHALAICFEIFTKKIRKNIGREIPQSISNIIGVFYTFGFFAFSTIFFRANSVKDALYVLANLFKTWNVNSIFLRVFTFNDFLIAVVFILLIEIFQSPEFGRKLRDWFNARACFLRWSAYYAVMLFVIFLGKHNNKEFIYFQF